MKMVLNELQKSIIEDENLSIVIYFFMKKRKWYENLIVQVGNLLLVFFLKI